MSDRRLGFIAGFAVGTWIFPGLFLAVCVVVDRKEQQRLKMQRLVDASVAQSQRAQAARATKTVEVTP